MMSHPLAITPPERIVLGKTPGIFLAGPIQHAPNWQAEATRILIQKQQHFFIMNPRRGDKREDNFNEEQYNQQVDWEHDHIDHARQYGVMLFWLAKPAIRTAERAYAQTTRFELGEAMVVHRYIGNKVVVGIEEGFGNEKYIRRTLAKKAPNIFISNNLNDTVEAAYQMLWK